MLDFIVMRLIMDIVMVAVALWGSTKFYDFGLYVSNGSTFFGMCYTFLGALLIMGLINIIRSSFFAISKYGQIYMLTDCNKISSSAAIAGAARRFKNIISICFFNMTLKKVFNNLGRLISSKAEGTLVSDTLQPIFDSAFVKIPERFLKHLLSYLDECVLFYAFKHPEVPLSVGIPRALALFILNAGTLTWQLISTRVLILSVHLFVYLGGFLVLAKQFTFSVKAVFLILVFLKCLVLLLDDVALEPLVLSKVLRSFDDTILRDNRAVFGSDNDTTGSSVVEDLINKLMELIPELQVLSRFTREGADGYFKER